MPASIHPTDPLRSLEKFVAQVEFRSDSERTRQDHRDIYNFIEQTVLSPKSPIMRHVPTLEMIVYSTKNILYPTVAAQRIPDLLDLLATVEFYRGRSLDKARDALVWNNYYKTDTEITLTPQEEGILLQLDAGKDSWRRVYIRIIQLCCQYDMHNLWTSSFPSMTNFMIRFNEYFPFLNDAYDLDSPRLFHANLSEEEIAELGEVGLSCCDFAQDTVEWAINRRDDRQRISDLFQTDDFRNAFPCPSETLTTLIEGFLTWTNDSALQVKEILSDYT